jgi:hypothetical protein
VFRFVRERHAPPGEGAGRCILTGESASSLMVAACSENPQDGVMSNRPLTKREVEALLSSCEGASASALEEITAVREALAVALVRLVGGPGAPWPYLVADAAAAGGWSPQRQALLTAAVRPDEHPDPDSVLDALWDLVQELNERRRL